MIGGISRYSDSSTGHDSCGSIKWNNNVSPNTFVNGKGICIKGTIGSTHSCRNHFPHNPIIQSVSAKIFVNGKGIARKNDVCNCNDRVKEVSADVFSI